MFKITPVENIGKKSISSQWIGYWFSKNRKQIKLMEWWKNGTMVL
jgi:hypothetical protein